MELTKELREFAVKSLGVAEDASDDVFQAALAKALGDGTLSAADCAKMQAGGEDAMATLKDVMTEANKPIADGMAKMADAITKMAEGQAANMTDEEKAAAEKAIADKAAADAKGDDDADIDAKINAAVEKQTAAILEKQQATTPQTTAQAIMARGAKADVREIKATERYSTTKSVAICPQFTRGGRKHPMAGQPATFLGRQLDTPSELDKAIIGAWGKSQIFGFNKLNDHEKQLVAHAMHEMPWVGPVGCRGNMDNPSAIMMEGTKLGDFERKALIDDSTSGGANAVPKPFDDAIILTPVLFGELFPLVEVINLPQGSAVDGHSMSDPTINSNYTEGTGITLETTASIVAALDTSIFGCDGSIEIGLDFESDTPVNFGSLLADRFGIKHMEWLDNQIANGDGTTEPEGIFTKSGTTSVSSANGTSGPYVVADMEKLMFGLSKAMRASKGARPVYVTNDRQYRLARSIAVGSSDQRRVFGMDHAAYEIFDFPVKIQEDISLGTFGYCNLAYYRMYRRAGINITTIEGGKTLGLANTKIVMMRARWGGQLTRADALAVITDGPNTG